LASKLREITVFKQRRINSAVTRLFEEKLYELTLSEIESGNVRQGLWARALAESRGNHSEAQSTYLKLRVQSLKDEILISSTIEEWLASNKKMVESQQVIKSDNVRCKNCGVTEYVPLETIRNLGKTRYFMLNKKPLSSIVYLWCKRCGHPVKSDRQGRIHD
jgi:hypothetical protein